jgi:hypothetical protein
MPCQYVYCSENRLHTHGVSFSHLSLPFQLVKNCFDSSDNIRILDRLFNGGACAASPSPTQTLR